MTEEATEKEPTKLAGKQTVIEFSRRQHGMPRPEVERMIAIQMGWPTPEQTRSELIEKLTHRLLGLGITERQTRFLICSYPLERIERQLDWLPFRKVRIPTAFIVAAIRHNYRPPEHTIEASAGYFETPPPTDNSMPPKLRPNPGPSTEQEPNKP